MPLLPVSRARTDVAKTCAPVEALRATRCASPPPEKTSQISPTPPPGAAPGQGGPRVKASPGEGVEEEEGEPSNLSSIVIEKKKKGVLRVCAVGFTDSLCPFVPMAAGFFK